MVVSIDFPPKPSSTSRRSTYQYTVQWLNHELIRLPARPVPIIGMDLNDGLGMFRLPGLGWTLEGHPGVGPGAMEKGGIRCCHE
mmetsp:Transcript_20957/g.72326  ORF Transcript_20957/g.72326 Transcript_20957/m.72326 type:complete len:84 (+) Transcript_20957:172-423(+)